MNAKEQLDHLVEQTSRAGARLVAVSKTKPQQQIEVLYALGQRDFGENRVQELVEKQAVLPKDIRWHFIGHLQTKKVKAIAPFVNLIHAVDSWKLLQEIDKRAKQHERVIDCLLQFHIAEEESKYGLNLSAAQEFLKDWTSAGLTAPGNTESSLSHGEGVGRGLPGARIIGVMGMATYTDDAEQVSAEFKQLADIYGSLKKDFFKDKSSFKELSMGMSGDYPLALAAGSTLIRVGSLLFGARG